MISIYSKDNVLWTASTLKEAITYLAKQWLIHAKDVDRPEVFIIKDDITGEIHGIASMGKGEELIINQYLPFYGIRIYSFYQDDENILRYESTLYCYSPPIKARHDSFPYDP